MAPFRAPSSAMIRRTSKVRIAALGSSFAAGPGIDPIVDKAAARSGRNYAHQVAEQLGADLTDLTVSGATLLHVLKDPQKTRSGEVIPPQLEGLPRDTQIVTLTGGGNDISYSRGMTYDSIISSAPGPLLGLCGNGCRTLSQKEKAPRSRIYLVQYLSIFGQNSQPGPVVPLTLERIEHYRQRGEMLDKSYEAAAKARSDFVELVPAAAWSNGHEVDSEVPWVDGLTLGMLWKGSPVPYHPNLAGHTAIAEKLYDMIQKRQSGET